MGAVGGRGILQLIAWMLVAVALFGCVRLSSAANLAVATPRLGTVVAAPDCTTATLTVRRGTATTNITSVRITSVPTGCRSLPFTLTVYGSAGAVLRTVSGTTAATVNTTASFTPTLLASSVVGVALTIDSRGIATTWVP